MPKYEKCSKPNEQSATLLKKWKSQYWKSVFEWRKNNRGIAIKDIGDITSIAIVDSERNLHEFHINLSF